MPKKKLRKNWIKKIIAFKKVIIFSLIMLLFLISLALGAVLILNDRIYPGVSVAGVDLTAQTAGQAKVSLQDTFNRRLITLNFYHPESSFQINLHPGLVDANIDASLEQAFEYGHKKIYFRKVSLPLKISFAEAFEIEVKNIAQTIDQPPISSQLKVEGDQITVTPSQDGFILDSQKLKKNISDYLNTGKLPESNLPIKKVSPKLSYSSAVKIKNRLDQIKLSPLLLQFKDLNFTLSLDNILSLIDLENSESSLVSLEVFNNQVEIKSIETPTGEISDIKLTLNKDKLLDHLKNIKSQIDREVEEPLFSFDGKRVTEFRPPQEGRKLDLKKTADRISQALISPGQETVKLAVEVTLPKNKLTNELGIKELIGQGVSHFVGSIPNRIFNISLTASKINGVLIPPGEVFSFNNTVGDISASTGFKQAYVIKSGRTVLDDGGGVCQDSTTLFRAVLNAGLPVLKRTAHAYRVGYYEQGFPPGLDATVFSPSVDFQFKNDTGAHILIQAYTSGNSLYVDLYGTSDGRVASISTPQVSNQTPPPAELRQDDPTLPKGTVKQVDFSAWGATVIFKRKVTRSGQVLIDETYRSNYRPWQAIFLVGTKEN